MAVKSYDDLFRTDTNQGLLHPRLRRWQQFTSSGYRLSLTIDREWDGLTFSPAKLHVSIKHDGDPGTDDVVLWEDELNQGLVDLGVRGSDSASEVLRYALAFKSALAVVSSRHGQDHLRSALVEFLRDDVFASHPHLKDMLAQVHPAQAHRGNGYEQALATVESIIRVKAHELNHKLGYQEDVAFDILCRALAQYLDEIFHVSARRSWFPN
jgi:hypothetical protein